jgi:DNA polymerase III gamma/tau subunit
MADNEQEKEQPKERYPNKEVYKDARFAPRGVPQAKALSKAKQREEVIKSAWQRLEDDLTGEFLTKFQNELRNKVQGAAYVKLYLELMEYFKPKLARTTIVGDADAPIQQQVNIVPIGAAYQLSKSEDEVNTDKDVNYIDYQDVTDNGSNTEPRGT